MAIKCSGCGANMSSHDEVCSCCGSNNPEYHYPDRETVIFLGEGLDAYKAENYAAAIHSFNQAIDLDPDVFDAYFYLAASHSVLKQPEEAIKAMQKARALRPGSAPIYYNLAILYKQVGHQSEAKTHLEQALVSAKTDSAVTDQKQFEETIKKELAEFKRWKLF